MKKGSKLLIVILLILVLGLGGASYYLYDQWTEEQNLSTEYAQQILTNSKSVYVAIADIKTGDIISEGKNVEKQNIVTALAKEVYVDETALGKKAVLDIPNGTPLYKVMVTENNITNGTRLVELSTVTLPVSNIASGVYVDVRIMFPNGEDYIVLAKKKMSNLYLEQCLFTLELEEDEILTLSSAIVDTYTVTGTRMYVTTYVAPNVQEAPAPTYLVRKETLDLITSSPNVVKQMAHTLNASLREEMELRLSELTEEQLSAVSKGLGLTDTASSSVLLGIEREDGEVLNENLEAYSFTDYNLDKEAVVAEDAEIVKDTVNN